MPDQPDWIGTLTITVTLSDSEKKCLEAIALLGSFSANSNDSYPDEIDRLEEREFLHRERVGETFVRGRSRGDGVDVYHLTETAKLWLANCRPVDPATADEQASR
jgi:hypothetical protein